MTLGSDPHAASTTRDGMSGAPSLLDLLERLAAEHGHRIVLDDGHRRISPFLLAIAIPRLARAVADRAPPGPVAVWMPDGTMTVIATLAVLVAGRPCVVLAPGASAAGADGCAAIVYDPDAPVPTDRDAPALIDVFLSCAVTYADSGPDLPDVAPGQAVVRFGSVAAEDWPLMLLMACRSPAAPGPGPVGPSPEPSTPNGLGTALYGLLSGNPVTLVRDPEPAVTTH